jgi:predicted lipoprotein with Yx(FWY)xxD motif
MRRSVRPISMLALAGPVLLAALLLGCGSGSGSGSKKASGTPSPTPPTAVESVLAVETSDPTIAAQYATPVVTVTAVASGKRILTDDSGKTLYVFSDDVPASGTSQCTGPCATTWPPLSYPYGAGFQIPGLGIFGLFLRPEGDRQVMYRGRPLYRYSGDTSPGDTKGDGIDGKWSVAVP